MTKRKHSRMMLRIIAAAMAVALVSGTAVMTPIADFVGTNITASAATYTDSVDASQLKKGDILKKDLSLGCATDYFTVFDENNDIIVDYVALWDVDKDYTITSITADDTGYDTLYTIYVTSATSTSTSAPKLAQGLIIHSGDTVDFTGQWYMTDDNWGDTFCGEGVYTITYCDYDFGHQYRFLVGNTETYVTSLNIGTDVALKVNGGDGTESNPFTFEVVPASYTSAPKLAQGLIINSGDTVDFVNQCYMIDDNPKNGGWSWGQDVYTITYFYYDPDFSQYCFLLGDMQIYVTSPNIDTDVALKVKGGNGHCRHIVTHNNVVNCDVGNIG